MPATKAHTEGIGDWLLYALCAAISAWLALNIYERLFTNYATARFWETWLSPGSTAMQWAPVVTFGLITGIVIGVVVGMIFPRQAIRVVGIAAVLQLLAAAVSGGIAASVVTAVGLVLGALPSRTR